MREQPRSWFVHTFFVLSIGLWIAQQASAELCSIDPVAAATLLFPEFLVDLGACDQAGGVDTELIITNTAPETTVAHVTLWTDWAVPVLDFDLYLTGFDVETINARQLLCDGILQATGPTTSPVGVQSAPLVAGEHPQCEALLPYPNPALTEMLRQGVAAALTGQPVSYFGGNCAGADRGDDLAVGYVTVDVVRDCNLLFPSDPDYATTVLAFDNRLRGEYTVFEPEALPRRHRAVGLEADPTGGFYGPGRRTFYGHLTGGADRREPLPASFAAFFQGWQPDELNRIRMQVWRQAPTVPGGVPCGTTPAGLPFAASEVLIFDHTENPTEVLAEIPSAVTTVSPSALVPLWSGLTFFDFGPPDDSYAQAWMTSSVTAGLSTQLSWTPPAVALDSCSELP